MTMTSDPIHDAITAYVSTFDTNPMVTNYYLVADYIDSDGQNCWVTKVPPEQNLSSTLGLIEWARIDVHNKTKRYLDDVQLGDDDDE